MTSLLEWNKANAAIPFTFHEADVKIFLTLFSLCGHCEEAPEKHLDAITSPEKWCDAVTQRQWCKNTHVLTQFCLQQLPL